jgi:hypothetical protein
MYRSKPVIILFLFLLSFLSINCGNCDDENYRTENKENLNIKKTDSLILKK